MTQPVVKGAAYALIHAPAMLVLHGTTQSSERRKNGDASEYLQALPGKLRSFQEAVCYPPNQAFIGNLTPEDLKKIPRPWFSGQEDAPRDGRFGAIFAEDELIALVQMVDIFDLVLLEEAFQKATLEKVQSHPLLGQMAEITKLEKNHAPLADIQALVEGHQATPMHFEGKLVGCVKKAHEFDEALSHHVMFENLVSKATAVLALKLLLAKTDIEAEDIEYIIECSEEACGDMNQRGGGNFAKAIGEIGGLRNATGSDTRSFCAGPVHALVEAAALVKSGVYKHVVVLAGGATAKLGMNGKDHVKKDMPVLEDMLGAFAVLVSQDDGVNPIIRTDGVGRHTIGSGASPQAVVTAIVADPLDRLGLKITDIDKYSAEMQNPEITEPAGAGDVPLSNYKMIAALAVKRGEMEKKDLAQAVERFGMPGFAPTQGHIPSGVPFIGHGRQMLVDGAIQRAMIIGKGSLFLGRLTNLFDGVSFIMERSPGKAAEETKSFDEAQVKAMIADAMLAFAKTLKGE